MTRKSFFTKNLCNTMETTQTKQKSFKSSVVTYLIYLGVFLAIMGIIWLFIYPSFRHWLMESTLQPIKYSYVRDGGADKAWLSDGYDYYANVGFRGQNYRVNVSEGVYTGSTAPTFYYDASRDEVFESGTDHTKVVIFFLVFAFVFIVVFVYLPLKELFKKKTLSPSAPADDTSLYKMPES